MWKAKQSINHRVTKLYQVTVGSLKYIGNIQNLATSYFFEENYWNIFTQREITHLAKIEESKILTNSVLASH